MVSRNIKGIALSNVFVMLFLTMVFVVYPYFYIGAFLGISAFLGYLGMYLFIVEKEGK